MSEMIPEKKDNTTRNILIVVGVVAALCLCAVVVGYISLNYVGTQVGESIKTDPADVAQVANGIADFDLPPGYELTMAMSIATYDMVMITPGGNDATSLIMLMQANGIEGVDPEQMRQAMQQQTGQGAGMVVVETREETIRGQQVTVTISESRTQGITLRQLMTYFEGRGGLAILMIQGDAANWDQDMVEAFLKSIR